MRGLMRTPLQPFGSLAELDECLVMIAEDMIVHVAQMVIFALNHGAETFELSPTVLFVQAKMTITLKVGVAITDSDTVTIVVSFNYDDAVSTSVLNSRDLAELMNRFLASIQKDSGLAASLDHDRTAVSVNDGAIEMSIYLAPEEL